MLSLNGASISLSSSQSGRSVLLDNVTAVSALRHADNPYALNTFSCVALIKPTAITGNGGTITASAIETSTTACAQFCLSTTGKLRIVKPGVEAIGEGTVAVPLNVFSCAGVSYSSTTISDSSFYLNGIKDTSGLSARTFTHGAVGVIGGNFNNKIYNFPGEIAYVAYWNRLLTSAEHRLIADNPWRLFNPISPIYIGVPDASGAYTLTASSGLFALTGTAATLTAQRKVTADSGSFALTGTTAVLKHSHVLAANSGSIALTGTAATLTYTPVGGYTLPANGGSFTLSGTAASLLASRKVVAGSGSFTLTGTAATLSLVKLLTAGSGSFTLSGTAATFAKTNVLVAGEGAYSLVGTAATLTHGVSLTDSQKIDLILDILSNRQELDVSTGMYTLYADDGVTVLYTAAAWEDAAGTIPYRGRELRRLDALV